MTSSARSSVEPPASLTTEPDRFSDDAWDLLLSGQDLARRWRHGELDVEHLLQVLFSDRRYGDLVDFLRIDAEELLDRGRISGATFQAALDRWGLEALVELLLTIAWWGGAVPLLLEALDLDLPDDRRG